MCATVGSPGDSCPDRGKGAARAEESTHPIYLVGAPAMATKLICYDLNRPHQEYDELIDAIKGLALVAAPRLDLGGALEPEYLPDP